MDELQCILKSTPHVLHLILLSETWIKSDSEGSSLQIPNYTHHYNYRTDRRGGGVSIFVHNDLEHKDTQQNYIDGNNYLWIFLERYALNVGIIYKPPDTNNKDFIEYYSSQLQQKRRCIVFGDFNLDLLKPDRTTITYTNMIKEAGYKILNQIKKKYSTRTTDTTNTILDHVCSNLSKDNFHMAVIESSLSDHNHIYLELKKFKRPPKIIHNYTAIDYTNLYKDVSNTNIIAANNNNYHTLESIIKDKITKNTKMKSKILNLPRDDWINRKITTEIDKRNTLWRKLKNEPNNVNFKTDFITKRNEVQHFMKKEKRQYYFTKFSKCKSNPKKMWSLINYLSNNNPVTTCKIPKLNVNNGTVSDPTKVCETFNNFFASVGKDLATQIPHKFHNNLTYTTINSNPNTNHLDTLTPCTNTEIINIIDK